MSDKVVKIKLEIPILWDERLDKLAHFSLKGKEAVVNAFKLLFIRYILEGSGGNLWIPPLEEHFEITDDNNVNSAIYDYYDECEEKGGGIFCELMDIIKREEEGLKTARPGYYDKLLKKFHKREKARLKREIK